MRLATARRLTKSRFTALRFASCWLGCNLVLGCDSNPTSTAEQDEPPQAVVNADLVPAPVDPDLKPGTVIDPNPKVAREARTEHIALPFELQRPPESETITEGELPVGPLLSLEAHFTFPGQTTPGFAQLSAEQAELARRKTTTTQLIDLLPSGHLRLTFNGGAFALSAGATLLARQDRTGWLLLWPGLTQYRVLAAGSLLAVLREARADMAPLIVARSESDRALKERRFGFSVTRTLLTTNRGSLTLDQVEVPDTGTPGGGLCRFLLELLSAAPTAETCTGHGVPVRAHYEFAGTTFDWVVDSLKLKTEGFETIQVPPDALSFLTQGLPTSTRSLLTEAEFAALRKSERHGRMRIMNHDEVGAFITLEGTPIAFVAPHERVQLQGLPQGDLRIGVRDFMGVELTPTKPLKLEANTSFAWRAPADAGVPIPTP